jgi:hypothetical protein
MRDLVVEAVRWSDNQPRVLWEYKGCEGIAKSQDALKQQLKAVGYFRGIPTLFHLTEEEEVAKKRTAAKKDAKAKETMNEKTEKKNKPVKKITKESTEEKTGRPITIKSLVRALSLERKYTDEEIIAKVQAKFGKDLFPTEKYKMSLVRSNINVQLAKKDKIFQLFRYNGKMVTKEKLKKLTGGK